jgi:hypothetical protein
MRCCGLNCQLGRGQQVPVSHRVAPTRALTRVPATCSCNAVAVSQAQLYRAHHPGSHMPARVPAACALGLVRDSPSIYANAQEGNRLVTAHTGTPGQGQQETEHTPVSGLSQVERSRTEHAQDCLARSRAPDAPALPGRPQPQALITQLKWLPKCQAGVEGCCSCRPPGRWAPRHRWGGCALVTPAHRLATLCWRPPVACARPAAAPPPLLRPRSLEEPLLTSSCRGGSARLLAAAATRARRKVRPPATNVAATGCCSGALAAPCAAACWCAAASSCAHSASATPRTSCHCCTRCSHASGWLEESRRASMRSWSSVAGAGGPAAEAAAGGPQSAVHGSVAGVRQGVACMHGGGHRRPEACWPAADACTHLPASACSWGTCTCCRPGSVGPGRARRRGSSRGRAARAGPP